MTKRRTLPFRYRPWHPYHMQLILSDLFKRFPRAEFDSPRHLNAVIDWLCRAQDLLNARPDSGGISAGWSFEDGWLPGYPETSGYIVETFVAASRQLGRPELLSRARRILDWELSIQQGDGSFPGHFGEPGSRPVTFNTGQIMHGMLAGYLRLKKEDCLESAVRAGMWMTENQDGDGCWRKHVHNNQPHAYNSRAAWALLRTGLLSNETRLVRAAKKNLDWTLSRQTDCGWFKNNAFLPHQVPFTHTIAYAVRGLLESGVLLKKDQYVEAAMKAALALACAQQENGRLAGTFDDHWVARANYCCITGLAQTSIIWKRLEQETGKALFATHFERGLSYLKQNHTINGSHKPADGGMPGSVPIWGAYSRFEFPNWAAKFFADALMMDMDERI